MKKLVAALLCLLLVGLCACEEAGKGETTVVTTQITSPEGIVIEQTEFCTTERMSIQRPLADNESEYGPYNDILVGLIERSYYCQYALYDLDGNGTKELLLGEDTWVSEKTLITSIYTIQDGEAVYQDEFLWDPLGAWEFEWTALPVLYKNGTIMLGDYFYYRLEKNGAIIRTSVIEEDGKYYRFIMNGSYPGTPISKKEFDRIRKEFEGDGQVVVLDWKPLAEYGRQRKFDR